MDRETSLTIATGRIRADGPVLPSRRAALDRLLPAVRRGPVLISGEAGSGKTWVARVLAEESGAGLVWVEIDIAPSMKSAEFFAAIASGLDLDPRSDRTAIAAALADSTRDGRPRALRVDEAQNASAELLEEIRILDNRLGRPDGFAAIVLVAQTPLVRRLNLRILGGLEVRLAAHAHLMPIDADEAEILLGKDAFDGETAESLHRAAMGNPARLLRLALAERASPTLDSREAPVVRPILETSPGSILPTRPPLSVEDGVIEVGWDSEADSASNLDENADPEPETDQPDDEVDVAEVGTTLRAEGEQDFAPYSQLFARLRQANERQDRSVP